MNKFFKKFRTPKRFLILIENLKVGLGPILANETYKEESARYKKRQFLKWKKINNAKRARLKELKTLRFKHGIPTRTRFIPSARYVKYANFSLPLFLNLYVIIICYSLVIYVVF